MTIMICMTFGTIAVHFSTNMLTLNAFPEENNVLAEPSTDVLMFLIKGREKVRGETLAEIKKETVIFPDLKNLCV